MTGKSEQKTLVRSAVLVSIEALFCLGLIAMIASFVINKERTASEIYTKMLMFGGFSTVLVSLLIISVMLCTKCANRSAENNKENIESGIIHPEIVVISKDHDGKKKLIGKSLKQVIPLVIPGLKFDPTINNNFEVSSSTGTPETVLTQLPDSKTRRSMRSSLTSLNTLSVSDGSSIRSKDCHSQYTSRTGQNAGKMVGILKHTTNKHHPAAVAAATKEEIRRSYKELMRSPTKEEVEVEYIKYLNTQVHLESLKKNISQNNHTGLLAQQAVNDAGSQEGSANTSTTTTNNTNTLPKSQNTNTNTNTTTNTKNYHNSTISSRRSHGVMTDATSLLTTVTKVPVLTDREDLGLDLNANPASVNYDKKRKPDYISAHSAGQVRRQRKHSIRSKAASSFYSSCTIERENFGNQQIGPCPQINSIYGSMAPQANSINGRWPAGAKQAQIKARFSNSIYEGAKNVNVLGNGVVNKAAPDAQTTVNTQNSHYNRLSNGSKRPSPGPSRSSITIAHLPPKGNQSFSRNESIKGSYACSPRRSSQKQDSPSPSTTSSEEAAYSFNFNFFKRSKRESKKEKDQNKENVRQEECNESSPHSYQHNYQIEKPKLERHNSNNTILTQATYGDNTLNRTNKKVGSSQLDQSLSSNTHSPTYIAKKVYTEKGYQVLKPSGIKPTNNYILDKPIPGQLNRESCSEYAALGVRCSQLKIKNSAKHLVGLNNRDSLKEHHERMVHLQCKVPKRIESMKSSKSSALSENTARDF